MQIIEPTYITDSTLISTDLSETGEGYPEWAPDVLYAYLQRVVITTIGIHSIYECQWPNDNLNKYPPDNLGGTTPFWRYISKTNPWKLFDMIVAPDRSESEVANITKWATGIKWQPNTSWSLSAISSMNVVITPGEIDSVALLNIDCQSIHIIMTDPDAGEVYNETKVPAMTENYNAIYSDLPAYPNATLQITLANSLSNVFVGELIVGKVKTIGTAKYGVGVSLIDFSQKEADDFGNFSILERIYSKRLDVPFLMPAATHDGILRLLEKYRSVPLVWIISNLYSTMISYGFYRDIQLSIPSPSVVECSVTIESLGGDLVNATPPEEEWILPWDGNIELQAFMLPTHDGATADLISETPIEDDSIALEAFLLVDDPIPFADVYLVKGTCTISNAAPCVVTFASHGIADNTKVLFHTTGTLPAPLVADQVYYVDSPDLNTFKLTLTLAGSTIDTTSAGSGTHTLYAHD
jgi:hypothetical protein